MGKFRFSNRSLSRMAGVHSDLVAVMQRAIELTEVDFGITEGLRTVERQKELVRTGASKTMNSRHLTGHAVDVAAYIGKDVRWDLGLYYKIAEAVRTASVELHTPVVWGACWSILGQTDDLDAAVADYVARKKRQGGRALVDGPHFELWRGLYT